MAMINVNRGANSLGIFSEEDVREGLRTGRFVTSDLGWREGMESWQTLGQFPEFAAEAGAAAAAPRVTTSAIGPGETSAAMPIARTGLPWENRQEGGFFNAFIETLVMVLGKPAAAFATMKTEGGLLDPLLYSAIGGSIGLIAYLLFNIAMQSFGIFANRDNALAGMIGAGMGTVLWVILAPFFVVLGAFVGAAIFHVCLMLVGGAKRSFETTFRVVCFAGGSAQPLLVIPFCGGLISGVWSIVLHCIGLARAHETDMGRAVLAVLLPVIVCCGGAFFLGMFGILTALKHLP